MGSDRTADVVVVGAGMAGLEAALALHAAGAHRVVVVDGSTGGTAPRWRSTTPPHYPDAGAHLGVGGRSLAWHGVVLRLEPWALADWPRTVAAELWNEWYGAVERDLEAWAGRRLREAPSADVDLAARLGVLTGTTWDVVPRASRSCGDRRRTYTPLDRWPVDRHRPEVVSGAVSEVVVDGGRVVGVRLDRGAGAVSSPTVLLAAGTLETTRLAAQARGRPDQAYRLADHLVEGLLAVLPPGVLPDEGLARWPADPGGRCTVFARTRRSGDLVLLDVWTMGEQLPSGASRVRFTGTEATPWTVLVDAGLDGADEAVLRAGRRRLAQVWAALDTGPGPSWSRFLDASRSFPEAVAAVAEPGDGGPVPYAWPLGTVDHEGSTLPHGPELDDAGRVRDVPGLWVTGPAAFPRPGAANPSLTTLALARRSARSLTRQ